MSYRMILNQTAHFGRGTIKLLPEELKKRDYKKTLLITDPILLETSTTRGVTGILNAAGFPYEVFSDVAPNPPMENVKARVKACADAGADVLLGLGGDPPQDTARAADIITTNSEFADVPSLEGVTDTKKPVLPIVGIPTTAGTASETTISYVITDAASRRKFMCIGPHDIPIVAIVDPDLMDSMPRALEVSADLGALTHAIGGYITPGAWELSDAVHLTSIRVVAENLRKSADGDRKAGGKMAYVSYIADIGRSNVDLDLVHDMAHPLGDHYGAPHGVTNGTLLPSMMRYNADLTGGKYRAIAHAFGVSDAYTMSLEDARKATCDKILALVVDLGSPTKISEVGVGESGLDALARDAFNDVCAPGNPRKATLEEIRALYTALL